MLSISLVIYLTNVRFPDADGRYSCKACHKAFAKERHYNRHRCISWGDYVDISKKESIDNMTQDSGEEDADRTSDFV